MKLGAWLTRLLKTCRTRRDLDHELAETETRLKEALGVEKLERPRLLGRRKRW